MRTVAIVYGGGVAAVYIAALLSAVIMRSSYADALEQALEESMSYAVMMQQADRDEWAEGHEDELLGDNTDVQWGTDGLDDFKKDFVSALTDSFRANIRGLDVEFYGADEEYGMLSVKATVRFQYPWLVEDSVSRSKTVVLDKVSGAAA